MLSLCLPSAGWFMWWGYLRIYQETAHLKFDLLIGLINKTHFGILMSPGWVWLAEKQLYLSEKACVALLCIRDDLSKWYRWWICTRKWPSASRNHGTGRSARGSSLGWVCTNRQANTMTQWKLYAKDVGQENSQKCSKGFTALSQADGGSWENTILCTVQHLFSIHCSLALVLAACIAIMALEWDTAKLSSCTALDWRGTPVCSGWHPAQMQVNTFRDSVAAAGPRLKSVSVSPLHNSRIRAALPRPVPGSIFHHFKPKFTPFFTLSDTLFRFYFYTSQIPAPLRWSVSSEQERAARFLRGTFRQNVRVKHF